MRINPYLHKEKIINLSIAKQLLHYLMQAYKYNQDLIWNDKKPNLEIVNQLQTRQVQGRHGENLNCCKK